MADGEIPQPPPPLADGAIKPKLSTAHKSYAQIAQAPIVTRRFETDGQNHLKPISVFQGKPSIIFKASEKSTLLGKMKFVLVGKFSRGRPPMVKIKTFLVGLKLLGSFNV
ncbi:hypothetical protein LIER_20661 [Lithospermum erythrorhizon]|uniref:Uncharacterized protein n=1 Tax=Lithospermum erythrorhizon TaxID=34254 RepID=A0AAV3QRE5_LITER